MKERKADNLEVRLVSFPGAHDHAAYWLGARGLCEGNRGGIQDGGTFSVQEILLRGGDEGGPVVLLARLPAFNSNHTSLLPIR